MEHAIIWLFVAAAGGFLMAFANGANDVANSFASAVGAKAITAKQATLIAGLMNFLGSAMLGGIVSAKLITGLINPSSFSAPEYVCAMLSVLLAAATFVLAATMFKLPVSSSHSIVGSLVGVSFFVGGWEGVNVGEMVKIAMSWVASPLLAALGALILLVVIRKSITRQNAAGIMDRLRFYLPYLLAIAVVVFAVLLMKKSIKAEGDESTVSVVLDAPEPGAAARPVVVLKEPPETEGNGAAVTRFELEESPELPRLTDTLASEEGESLGAMIADGWGYLAFLLILLPYAALVSQALLTLTTKSMKDDAESAEFVFRRLQMGTSSYVAFAHGANDVANAISPAFGIYLVYVASRDKLPGAGLPNDDLLASVGVPMWLLVLGGAGIAAGIGLLGTRVIETLSEKVTTLNNTRGFCVDFSAASTVVGASFLGIPVSSTHAATGAIMGSGLADREQVRWKMLLRIFTAWIVTVPIAAGLAILFFLLGRVLVVG